MKIDILSGGLGWGGCVLVSGGRVSAVFHVLMLVALMQGLYPITPQGLQNGANLTFPFSFQLEYFCRDLSLPSFSVWLLCGMVHTGKVD